MRGFSVLDGQNLVLGAYGIHSWFMVVSKRPDRRLLPLQLAEHMKSQCSRPSAPCAHDDRAAPTMACSPRAGPMAGPLTLCPAPLAACGCVVPTPARSPKPYAHPFPSRSPVWQPRSPLSSDTRRKEHAPPSFSIACPELPASHIFSHRLQPSLPLRSRHRHAFTRCVPQPSIASHPAYPPSAPRFPHESSVVSAPHHGGTPDALRLAPSSSSFLIGTGTSSARAISRMLKQEAISQRMRSYESCKPHSHCCRPAQLPP